MAFRLVTARQHDNWNCQKALDLGGGGGGASDRLLVRSGVGACWLAGWLAGWLVGWLATVRCRSLKGACF